GPGTRSAIPADRIAVEARSNWFSPCRCTSFRHGEVRPPAAPCAAARRTGTPHRWRTDAVPRAPRSGESRDQGRCAPRRAERAPQRRRASAVVGGIRVADGGDRAPPAAFPRRMGSFRDRRAREPGYGRRADGCVRREGPRGKARAGAYDPGAAPRQGMDLVDARRPWPRWYWRTAGISDGRRPERRAAGDAGTRFRGNLDWPQ